MASKKGAHQRRFLNPGKGGQKKPARASVHKVTLPRTKRKVPRLSQRELAALARERFLRSQRSKEAWRKRKTIAAQEAQVAEVRKGIEEKFEKRKEIELRAIEKKIKFQRKFVKELEKTGSEFHFYERQRRELLDLERDRDILTGKTPASAIKTQEKIAIDRETSIRIAPTSELLADRAKRHYEEQLSKGKLVSISKRHATGKRWRVDNEEREGFVIDRKVGKVVSEENLEELIFRMMEDAQKVRSRVPGGMVYASFSFFEYGRGVPKSSLTLGLDDLGTFYQSFDSTSGESLGQAWEAYDLAGFEAKLRTLFNERLNQAQGKNTVLLISDQVKAFHTRTDEEKKVFRRNKRLKKQGNGS